MLFQPYIVLQHVAIPHQVVYFVFSKPQNQKNHTKAHLELSQTSELEF